MHPRFTRATDSRGARNDENLIDGLIEPRLVADPTIFMSIPAELRERRQWVVWRWEPDPANPDKPKKPPYIAFNPDCHASSTKPETWASYATAAAVVEAGKADGIGFALEPPFIGVDLDATLPEEDQQEIIRTLDSYTERSPSGLGYHILVRADLDGRGRHPEGIGVFQRDRFIYCTGSHVTGAPTTIEPRQAQLEQILAMYLPAAPAGEQHKQQPVDLDDRDLLERAFSARNGADFHRLYKGDTTGFPSASEADLSLCGRLAFWTGRDAVRIDRMFKASGLMRDKWERADYRDGTIAAALAGCHTVYEPIRAPGDHAADDLAGALLEHEGIIGANQYLRSDLGNAEFFADRHAPSLRYVKERRLWLVWESGRWRTDTTGAAERAAKELARERLRAAADVEGENEQKKAVGWAMTSQSDPRIRAALSLATTESAIVLRANDLDCEPFLFCCANGTLNLRTGELRSPDPDDLITLGNEVNYDPDAACPRWDRFLHEVFDGDRALIGYVRRLAGYSLTGDVREQVVAVLHGSGGNGKDTMLKPIQRIFGEHVVTASMDTFTRTRDKGVRNDLARLHRARLVVASESGEGKRLDEPTIKAISGGNKIAARFLYAEHFEFTPRFKVWLITNHRPRVEGDDDAIWRRLRLIPFHTSFIGREDKELDAKLEAELPGIFAWVVRGCLEWQTEGLGLPEAVAQATHQYRIDEDVLGAFIAEQCVLEGEITPAELREAYERFCSSIGEKPLSANVLGKKLALRGIKRATRGRRPVYTGVRLR